VGDGGRLGFRLRFPWEEASELVADANDVVSCVMELVIAVSSVKELVIAVNDAVIVDSEAVNKPIFSCDRTVEESLF